MFYSAAVSDAKRTKRRKRKVLEIRDPEARRTRIIDVAIELAAAGGFENVRQRDVAKRAGVALGTLYKSFRSKEDILAAALERETAAQERRLERKPAAGTSAVERLTSLFSTLTRALLRKPAYARALLRAVTSGEEVAMRVVAHQIKVTGMVVAAMRSDRPGTDLNPPPSEEELTVAVLLQQIWFASLVGWSAKLHGQARVVEQMRDAASRLLPSPSRRSARHR